LGIFSSLLRLLPAESAGRIRTLAKFVEKDYEKIEKLIKLRRDYASKLSSVERKIEEEQKKMDRDEQEAMGDEWLSRRLDAGLFSLQVFTILPRSSFATS
jgi:beta-catenin-like protein 1